MAKVTVVPVGSMENQTTFVQTLNANFEAIAAAIETLLSRDGTTPNQMAAALDMNSERVLNLPSPVSAAEPARLIDLQESQILDVAVLPSMTGNEDKVLSNDGSVYVWADPGTLPGFGDLVSTNNLSDVVSVSAARSNLGLGTAATKNISTTGNNVPVLDGTNTWSAGQTFSGTVSATGAVSLGGTVDHRLTAVPTALSVDSIGFRGAPVATQDTSFTFALTDSGRTKLHTSATPHTFTIPPNSTVAFPLGTVFLIRNTGTAGVTLARGSGVALRLAGSATDANATIAQWGLASVLKTGTDSWVVSGSNVS